MPEADQPAERRLPAGTIPSLDGIRAVAVGLVFLAHSGLERWVPGGLGVTIFFVLSGYLITTLMRDEHAESGGLNYRAFYLRRLFRLMPPLVVVVSVAGLLASLDVINGDFSIVGLLSTLFYVGNYYVIDQDFGGLPQGLGVVWSLAVEEHFYLFYPPLALLLLKSGSSRVAGATLIGLCIAVLGWRCYLSLDAQNEAYVTMATDTRIDAILVGCVMALLCNPRIGMQPVISPLRASLIVAGCGGVLLLTLLVRNEFFRHGLRYTVQSLAIAPLIYLAVAQPQAWFSRWLNWRPMVYIGGVSYTIYLAHHLIIGLVHKQLPGAGWLLATLLAAALTLAVSDVVRRWVERPFAELRRRLHRRPGTPEPLLIGRPAGAA